MLKIPVYARNGVYYLHTRVNGKQFKRSLLTSDKRIATIKALHFLSALNMEFDPSKIRKFEVDIHRGIFKSDGEDDHRRMMETLQALSTLGFHKSTPPQAPLTPQGGDFQKSQSSPLPPKRPGGDVASGLRLPELVDKFFNLKKLHKPSTAKAYKMAATEFAGFMGNPYIQQVSISDVTRYQEHLSKKNHPRTIDNKVDVLRVLFNFAIKQGYYFDKNPAAERTLMSKRDKAKGGYEIFEDAEICAIYQNDRLAAHKKKDPDFYFCILLGLITGCRISEITSLLVSQVRAEPVPHIKITDSKTLAGVREIPLPQIIYDELKAFMPTSDKIFRYKERLGKGSGNAVSQKFKRHMEAVEVKREGLVFHSLRKYLNNYMMNNGIQIEARCQFFGHELENVNVSTYARKYTLEKLAELTSPAQQKVLELIKFAP